MTTSHDQKNSMSDNEKQCKSEVILTFREPLAVLSAIVLTDASFYHGAGYAGIAAALLGLLLLFFCGVLKPRIDISSILFAFLGIVVSLKLLWCGHPGSAMVGFGTVLIYGALQTGRTLKFPDLTHYVFQSPTTGIGRLISYARICTALGKVFQVRNGAVVLIPLITVVIFSTLFVMANPNLLAFVQNGWTKILEEFGRFTEWVPYPAQMLCWLVTAILIAGLLAPRPMSLSRELWDSFTESFSVNGRSSNIHERPVFKQVSSNAPEGSAVVDELAVQVVSNEEERCEEPTPKTDNVMFLAYRNTLISVIMLFIIYLVFEFRMNWLRNFPDDLDYSGYMHQGAMFLTIALVVSTLVLCTIFTGNMLTDPRIVRLRRLAWIWSALNFFLALSVYNRLAIYVELNGLSRLRIAGFLGSTAVLLGFIVVVRKIAASKDFRWLLSRYTWSVLFVIFIGFAVPFDSIIARHNVHRVMNGELLPSIFLFPAPNAPETLLLSLPLLEHEDETIREGSRAIFCREWVEMEDRRTGLPDWKYRWTTFQYSEKLLRKKLETKRSLFADYLGDPERRNEVIRKFRSYTNRWMN